MDVEVNGTRLWFDVDGVALVPDGPSMRRRPTIVAVHGGPATYDHSYLKPWCAALTAVAQVVYVDLRGHGRSASADPATWSFEQCADDLAALVERLGIEAPVVLGHSMGGIVALLLGARHPDVPSALVLVGTMARFDLDRLVDGFRGAGGDRVAALARRDYGGDPVNDAEWREVFAAFGPHVPDDDTLARRVQQLALADRGMRRLRELDVTHELDRITCPTQVVVGTLDAVTPVGAAQEIFDGLAPGVGRLEVLDGAGHFPWLDDVDAVTAAVTSFVTSVG
jgi:pimeloyl-ACP methyl ester carboxylesterase